MGSGPIPRLDLLEWNVQENQHAIREADGSIVVKELDWGNSTQCKNIISNLGTDGYIDVIAGSDVSGNRFYYFVLPSKP